MDIVISIFMDGYKTCSVCLVNLPLTRFSKSLSQDKSKIYYNKYCYKCKNNKSKEYRIEFYKNRRINNPEIDRSIKSKYRNSEKGKSKRKKYYLDNKKDICDKRRSYYKLNKNRFKELNKIWESKNLDKVRLLRKRAALKRKLNPVINFALRLRSRLRTVFKTNGISKLGKTFDLLGYNSCDLFDHLKKYLDLPCEDCKTIIINARSSHIDHIIPLCSASSKEDIIRLNQLFNLRLICSTCNIKKLSFDLRTKYVRLD